MTSSGILLAASILGVKAVTWMTPVWILGVGLLAGLVILALLWAVLFGIGRIPGLDRLRRVTDEAWNTIREGVLFWLLWLASVFAVFGIVGTFLLRDFDESVTILSSLLRIDDVGPRQIELEIPATLTPEDPDAPIPLPAHEVPVDFRGDELYRIQIRSTAELSLALTPDAEMDSEDSIGIRSDRDFVWEKRPYSLNPFRRANPFGEGPIDNIYVRNRDTSDATIVVDLDTRLAYPEVRLIPVAAIGLIGVFLLYFLQSALMPRMSAIALSTFKSEVAQPLFVIILLVGVVALILFNYMPYNTFGEDIKMLKDSGLTLIKVLCIILAVWGASTTIADEIDGRTALTVLSKPIGRRSFVIGKFLGISWATALMYIALGTVFLAVVAYKPIYDARETSSEIPSWQLCHLEMIGAVPGLLLGYMETVVLASLSVAISTRLPMLANFIICFSVYVLGHLTPLIVQVTDDRFEIVKFFGQLVATVFPNLETFDIQAAIAAGIRVPLEYLGWSFLYCLIFSVIAMLLALVLFEDRDLA